MYRFNRKLAVLTGVCAAVVLMATAIAYADVTTKTAGAITNVAVVRGEDNTTTKAQGWVDVPKAMVAVDNSGGGALFLLRFSGESQCSDTPGSTPTTGFCNLRITVNGIEAAPVVGGQFAFDTNSAGTLTDNAEAHAIDRSIFVLSSAKTANVQVQYRTTNSDTTFTLDDWQLTVERAKP
jgi:hypothetical protein